MNSYNVTDTYSDSINNLKKYTYSDQYNSKTELYDSDMLSFNAKTLSSDLNIFSELKDEQIKHSEAKKFISCFKNILSSFSENNLTFPKLQLTTSNDQETEISWISNYFRVYFSFETNSKQNSYGMIVSKKENNYFSSMCEYLNPEKYNEIIMNSINFFISKYNGL